jgi:hypothetical protein
LIPLRTQTPSQFRLISSIFFMNSSGHPTRVTFTLSAYPISSDRLTRTLHEQLTQTPLERLTRALSNCINVCPALYIRTRPNYLTRSDICLPGLTRSYPTKLPYLISSRSDFCLPDCTRPPYSTSLPDRVTPRCTQLLARPYPITLPGQVPINWPHPNTPSTASHLDLGLLG